MAQRRFVEPLGEIAPDVRSLLKKTVHELLDSLPKGGPKVKDPAQLAFRPCVVAVESREFQFAVGLTNFDANLSDWFS
jgi:hypothetical protein